MKKKYFTEEERKAAKARNAKKYRERNKERVRQSRRDWGAKNKEKLSEYRQQRRDSSSGYVDRFVERAKLFTPDTDIDREFFEGKMKVCEITEQEFEYKNSFDCFHNPLAPSLDQINPSGGYYKTNVQVILACVNRCKNDMPNEDFLKLWKELTK